MDKDTEPVVLILGGGRGTRLDPLTRLRSKPAVPIAGKFRLIDIPISNCIHSGMERIYVLTQFNSESLHRHIAQTYSFDRFSDGFVQILAAQQRPGQERWFQGTADAVRQNLEIVRDTPASFVLILSGDHIYRMDYRRMVEDQVERGADITIAVLPCAVSEIASFGCVRVDERARVAEFREKPADAAARSGMAAPSILLASHGIPEGRPFLASMGIYLFRKEVLIDCLENELHDFGHHVIPQAVLGFKVQAHLFDGYWRDIGTIRAFYDAHMDLVRANPPFDLYDPEWPFFTHARFLPGSRLRECRFDRAILADGCNLDAATVEDSIIGVRAAIRRASVRRSIVMGADPFVPVAPPGAPPVGIGEGTEVADAIIDKNARIGRGVRLVNPGVLDAEGPGWVIREGIVVVPKNAIVADGTEL